MRSAILSQFPPAPPDRLGWPWNDASRPAGPVAESDGATWPRVSIVTPSYNQSQFLEETIRSVLLQGYPNLEYIIIDAGSADNSVEIIRKYESWLAYWVSEPDKGQSHAVNKGWQRASGEILGWLNSDDILLPGALAAIGQTFSTDPELAMVYGDCQEIDAQGQAIKRKTRTAFNHEDMLLGRQMPQPSVFIHRRVLDEVGFLNEHLQWALDTEFFMRIWMSFDDDRIRWIPKTLSQSRVYPATKSNTGLARITEERRIALGNVFATRPGRNTSGRMKALAYANTYWAETDLYLAAGQPRPAMKSAWRAIRIAPSSIVPRRIFRLLARRFLPDPFVTAVARIILRDK